MWLRTFLVFVEIVCVDHTPSKMDMTQELYNNNHKRSHFFYILGYRGLTPLRGDQRGSWWICSSQYHLNIIPLKSYTKSPKPKFLPCSILRLAKCWVLWLVGLSGILVGLSGWCRNVWDPCRTILLYRVETLESKIPCWRCDTHFTRELFSSDY